MFRATYPEQSNTAGFITTVTVRDKSTGEVYDLTDVDVQIEISGKCGPTISASLGDGVVTVSDPTSGEIEIAVPASSMQNLTPGTYDFGVAMKAEGDEPVQVMLAKIPVAQGLPKWA